jgi:hypothetical protein
MADRQIDGEQLRRIHLTVAVLAVLVTVMFVSAAFLRLGA